LAINFAGGFGIGLGIGGAIATPLGNLAFGQGDSKEIKKLINLKEFANYYHSFSN